MDLLALVILSHSCVRQIANKLAPSFLPDADDTARTILSLIMLGEHPNVEPMLAEFEAKLCFVTFHGERNPSLSANCNILLSLLRSSDRAKYSSQISKAATYISSSWLAGKVQDKWVGVTWK